MLQEFQQMIKNTEKLNEELVQINKKLFLIHLLEYLRKNRLVICEYRHTSGSPIGYWNPVDIDMEFLYEQVENSK